ncbi:MAG: HAMP domain-containing protein [Sphingomonadales bacterium]|nr:HAMP domain-containing protein [Sphingomonadales bacterium]
MPSNRVAVRLRLADIRDTTTFRLAALFGVAFVVTICALAGLIYALTARELTARTDQVLRHEMDRLLALPSQTLPANVRAAMSENASGLNYFALLAPDGRIVAGNLRVPARQFGNRSFEVPAGELAPAPLRLLARRTALGDQLVLARDITQILDLRARMLQIVAGSALMAIASALALGAGLSIGPLRRIQLFRSVANRIGQGDLRLRMPVTTRRDELDSVAATINAMVEEVERLMDQVKGATDAIAHDLRAPLVHLRTRLELLCESGGEVSKLAESATEQLDLVLARFTALLRISELEVSGRRAGFKRLDAMALAAEVCELFEPLAEDRGIHLALSGSYGAVIVGDEKLLFEALSNLVENAIKFIPPGGAIGVLVALETEGVRIEVTDNGPGIPEDERDSVLRRFHRGSAARTAPGSGLGLNLVAAILHLHGFALALEDAQPGLRIRIRCPRGDGAAR